MVMTFSTLIYCKNATDILNSDILKNLIFPRDWSSLVKEIAIKITTFKVQTANIKVMHDDFFVRVSLIVMHPCDFRKTIPLLHLNAELKK